MKLARNGQSILSASAWPSIKSRLSAAAIDITGMIPTPDCPAREPTCVHQRNPDQPRGTLQQYHTYSARIGSAMSLHNFPFDAHILEVGVRFPQLFKGRREPTCGTWLLPVRTRVSRSDTLEEWDIYGARLEEKITPGDKVRQVVRETHVLCDYCDPACTLYIDALFRSPGSGRDISGRSMWCDTHSATHCSCNEVHRC
jgi:hypothetical protein